MVNEIVECLRRTMLFEIFRRGAGVVAHGEEFTLDQIGLNRCAHAKRQIGFALCEIEFAILEDQAHLDFGKLCEKPFKCAAAANKCQARGSR